MNSFLSQSIKWSITAGVNKGYDLSTQERMSEEQLVGLFREAAAEVEQASGVYITAVMNLSRTIYKEEWGCPPEGEYTCTFSGSCNTAFSDCDTYRSALFKLAEILKKKLRQSTLLLEIVPAEICYLRDE